MKKKIKRAALYLRVSTGEQITENQRRELEAVAQQRGWQIVAVYEDKGVSGAKGRDKRPQFDTMLKDAMRGQFDVLAVWAVDRLGRSLQDLVATLGDLQAAGVDLFLHRQAIDTTTPSGKAMYQMLGVFAEFERSMIQERVKAGLERAKAKGVRLGRPPLPGRRREEIMRLHHEGRSQRGIARDVGVALGTVQNVLREAGRSIAEV